MQKSQANGKIDTLASLANLVNAVKNDIHYMHLMSAGKTKFDVLGNWDELHRILGEYYEKLSEDYDTISELAIQVGEVINNPNESAVSLSGYQTVEQFFKDGFLYGEAFDIVDGRLKLICEAAVLVNLKYSRGTNEGGPDGIAIQNFIGEFLQYWTKERNYKNARRIGTQNVFSGEKKTVLLMKKSHPVSNKLEYFRKKILEHLETLEDDGGVMEKGAKMPVGTIREWKGKKYIKVAPDKWQPKYDNESRGAKMAISAIKKKINTAKDEQEMMNIILENRSRFEDKYGHPLPFVQELSEYIRKRGDEIELADNAKTKESHPKLEKIPIGKVEKWLVDEAKAVGLNIDGYEHEITNEFVNHVMNRHGNKEKEAKQGQIAITENDIAEIPNILKSPDYVMIGAKSKGLNVLVYAKKQEDGTTIYFEEVLDGKKNKSLRGKTMYKWKGDVSKENLKIIAANNGKTDISKAKIISLAATGGYPDLNPITKESGMVASPIKTQGSTTVSTDSDEKSTPKNKRVENIKNIKNDYLSNKIDRQKCEELLKNEGIKTFKSVVDEWSIKKASDKKSGEKNDVDSDFEKIKQKYQSAKVIEGDEDEVMIGKETLTGKWKLVEADIPTASHDETSFNKTSGFPTNSDGSSINDRDYEHFEANKEAVINAAGDFDGRALKFDNPVIVTTDGIVISGNNRTMSSKLAAKKGTDKKYIETLKKRAKKFGFTSEDVEGFKNPRVVFEVDQHGAYSTAQFAKFNESGKKEMGPTEKAAKVSKMINTDTIETVAKKIEEFDTIGELYQDTKASQEIYNIFKNAGLIGENEAGRYFENGTLTDDGKTFIETALLGTVINEANLRGFNRPGCKSIRSTLMRALIPLVENKGMNGYSINNELNTAIDITMQVAIEKDKFKNVDDFAKQQNMFETIDPVAVELAKKLEGTQKQFSDFMRTLNGGLKTSVSGEIDIFLGEVESKEDILKRILKTNILHKAIDKALEFFPWMRNMGKSLTYSGYPLQGRTKVQGMNISIENKKGSIRSGIDKDGHEWHTKMHFDYGYIRGTVGVDKDHLDVYVGPNRESETVFIVNQNDPVTGKFDEQKVMLGFNSEKDAKDAYLKQYDRPGFFGDMVVMDIETFKEKAFDIKNKGKSLKKSLIKEEDLYSLARNAKFEKLFYHFFVDDSGKIGLNRKTLKELCKLKGFPEYLSIENVDFHHLSDNTITLAASGDWQDECKITLGVKNGKLEIVDMFRGNEIKTDRNELSKRFRDIEGKYGEILKKSVSSPAIFEKSMNNIEYEDDEEKLEYFRKMLLQHLEDSTEEIMSKAKAFNMGHITTRKDGKRYKKVGPNKWVEVRDNFDSKKDEDLKKTHKNIEDAQSTNELMQIVFNSKEMFSDEKGNPISIIQEMKDHTQRKRLEPEERKQSVDDNGKYSKVEREEGNNNSDDDKETDNVTAKTFIHPDQFNAAEWSKQWNDSNATPDESGAEYILKSFGENGKSIANGIRDADSKNRRLIDNKQLTHQLYRISGEGESARYTPEREKLHGEIMQKLLSPDKLRTALPPPGQKPKFIILGGRGGSGKSWFKNNIYDPNTAVILDADEIKSMIPEYKGWNANQVHEESSDILEQMISMCIRDGLNIVLDATMKTANSALAKVFRFKSAGYKTEAHYMHLPKQEAAKRAIGRFMGSPEKGKEDEFAPFQGRYVPVTAVLKNTTNEDSFEQVRQFVDEWSFRDNNVKRGEQPILISEGKKK